MHGNIVRFRDTQSNSVLEPGKIVHEHALHMARLVAGGATQNYLYAIWLEEVTRG